MPATHCSPVRKVAPEPQDSVEFTKGRRAGRVAAPSPAARVNRAFLAPRPTAAPLRPPVPGRGWQACRK